MYEYRCRRILDLSIGRERKMGIRSGAPAMHALLAGGVDMMFDTTLGMLPQLQSGRLRALMTSSAKPLAALPAVPTMDSLFPGSGIQGWHGIFAPAGTPKDVVNLLAEAIRKAVGSAETSAKLRELGLEPSDLGPDRFAEVVKRDHARWGKVIRDNNIKAD